jgi:thiol-disulfide isomerase/thioredoxin
LASQEATGIDLYVKPDRPHDTKPDEPDEPDRPEVDPRKADPKAYSTLYSETREKGVIVIFGASWCGWCKIQRDAIPDNYRLLYVEVDEKRHGKQWRELMTKWGVVANVLDKEAPTYPTTVVAVDGVPVTHWYGWKPWRSVEKRCEKAKAHEQETEQTDGNWGGGHYNRYTPPRRQRRYTPRFGRWARP